MYTDVCFLEKLIQRANGEQVIHIESMNVQAEPSDMSGLEIVSPHKATSGVQKLPCTVEGVGEIRSSWIGQKGVRSRYRRSTV